MEDYREIADRVSADIVDGRLPAGSRLPPQRAFARTRGIASSTAARVYAELVRRGLAVGEVGRGTFVRSGEPPTDPALAEPSGARLDLELNFPIAPRQAALLAESLAALATPEMFGGSMGPVGADGFTDVRDAAARLLSRAGWMPAQENVLFAGNGRQAIAAAMSALVPPGGKLGVEPLTYPVVKAIAARLGVTLVPLPVDADGPLPSALSGGSTPRAVYLQPTLHNPLGATIPARRREEIAKALRDNEIHAIEDAIYGFLAPDVAPLAALAPEQVIVVDSLSKRVEPGLTLGFAVSPPALTGRVAAALRSGGWAAARFPMRVATRWIDDGVVAEIEQAKREDARNRQRLAAERLAGFDVRADPGAYHCWWELPEPWRAETFVAAAARRGIAVTPAAAFAVGTGRAPNAVRLALSAPRIETLGPALDVLAGIAAASPEDSGLE